MFRAKWVRTVVLTAVLASLLAVPLAASAQEAATQSGITAPANNASIDGTVNVAINVPGGANFSRWELLLFPNGVIDDNSKIWLAGGDQSGSVSYDLDTTRFPEGTHALVLRVVDSNSNYTDYVNTVTFGAAGAAATTGTPEATTTATAATGGATATPAAAATPTPASAAGTGTGITAPANNASVGGTVDVTGNVPEQNFSRWELLLFPNGVIDDNSKVWLAGGDQSGAVSYSLDTTQYPAGTHALVLRVVDPTSNYTDYTTLVTFGAAGAAAATSAPAATGTTTGTVTAATATATPAATAATAPPAAGGGTSTVITAPANNATVNGVVNVTANIPSTPSFSRWELLLFPNGVVDDSTKIWMAGGDQPGEITFSLDTSRFPEGTHVLAVRIVDATSNYTDYPITLTFGAAGTGGS